MSISRFNLETPADNMQSLYDFLNANKAGTFLENVTIELSQDASTLTISTTNATFEICVGAIAGSSNIATFTGNIISSLIAKQATTSPFAIRMKGAILCNNGLIIEIKYSGHSSSPEIALTIDNTGELAIIFKNVKKGTL